MTIMRTIGILTGALLPISLCCVLSASAMGAERQDAHLPVGLTVLDREGRTLDLGEVVSPGPTLIVFWRLDSRPSREALIHLHQNDARLRAKDVRPIAISPSELSAADAFVRSQGIGFASLYDPADKVAPACGLGYVYPSLLLLGDDLEILGKTEGGGDSFDANLSRLLETSGSPPSRLNWVMGAVLVAVAILALALGT